jgi:hypothetical protein
MIDKDFWSEHNMMSNYASLLQQLNQSNESIKMCEDEIGQLTPLITELQQKLDSMQELMPYHQIHRLIPAEPSTTYVDILPGAGIGLLTGGIMTGSFLLAACASVAGGALGLTALAISAFLKNNWNNPIEIEYHDLPFENVRVEYSSGVYVLIESDQNSGYYKAQFYPEVTEAEFKVTFFVKKQDLPLYQELATEQSRLELKQQQLTLLQNQHAILLQAQKQSDAEQRNKSRLLPPPPTTLDQTQTTYQNKAYQPGVR